MGMVSITDEQGNGTLVDKTWTFLAAESRCGQRIVLHHSSVPIEKLVEDEGKLLTA